jgi:hypothetical protein
MFMGTSRPVLGNEGVDQAACLEQLDKATLSNCSGFSDRRMDGHRPNLGRLRRKPIPLSEGVGGGYSESRSGQFRPLDYDSSKVPDRMRITRACLVASQT